MAEFVRFVNNGASLITPSVVEDVIRHIPVWKAEFTQIEAPKYPHLVDQLEFLANAVEDSFEGVYKELPYFALAEAVFALTYAHKKVDIIPDSIVDLGHADDSSVVRAVIMQNERAFEKYAKSQGISWQRITVDP
ncbi:MAG: hypothetical protein O2964_05290 [Verrucomicrobia bacterium]|jgi:uncharacterized membrane protein YkvA (DUF1232 family)|nr:hypothetical protein [Verrucomicrobiota bacterium]